MPQYSPAFNLGITFVLPHEDEYARGHWGDPNFVIVENVSGDAGGVTKYGIDAASNPGVDIPNLTQDGAIAIYWAKYWQAHNLDALPEKLAIASFDVWVNGGHAVAWLQAAINQASGKLITAVDGVMGPQTLAAANSCDQAAVLKLFIAARNRRFEMLASTYATDAQFLAGWEQRDADLEKYLAGIA